MIPENPEDPETPVYTDVLVKEPTTLETTQTVLSEEIIYDGQTGEETTTIAAERYVISTDFIELRLNVTQ